MDEVVLRRRHAVRPVAPPLGEDLFAGCDPLLPIHPGRGQELGPISSIDLLRKVDAEMSADHPDL
jgi:hypothetical protein